ncbi:hypothetical protein MPNT_270004 [Candidatus Methylacidithermus pantelleriae]|uniref:Uncharacterized protein n=1 Tax=Candidatus Methylacidithermus pantelleriae TaxID=2744239 RepID=A0A8J2BTN7_9BACT|nr:hypothetical protein MPNT_270004 [Candidatus Methylacidithermus pantelleriae]
MERTFKAKVWGEKTGILAMIEKLAQCTDGMAAHRGMESSSKGYLMGYSKVASKSR